MVEPGQHQVSRGVVVGIVRESGRALLNPAAVVQKGQTHEDIGITSRCLKGGKVSKWEYKYICKRKSGIKGYEVESADAQEGF